MAAGSIAENRSGEVLRGHRGDEKGDRQQSEAQQRRDEEIADSLRARSATTE
jgi:hypothetical protein